MSFSRGISHWGNNVIESFSTELLLHSLRIFPYQGQIISDLKKLKPDEKPREPNSKDSQAPTTKRKKRPDISFHEQLNAIINRYISDSSLSPTVIDYLTIILSRPLPKDPLAEITSPEFQQLSVNERIEKLDTLRKIIKASEHFFNKENVAYQKIKDPIKETNLLLQQILTDIGKLYVRKDIKDYKKAVTKVINKIKYDIAVSTSNSQQTSKRDEDHKESSPLSAPLPIDSRQSSRVTVNLSQPATQKSSSGIGFFSTQQHTSVDAKTPASRPDKILTKDSIIDYLKKIIKEYKQLEETSFATFSKEFVDFFEAKNNLTKNLTKDAMNEFRSIRKDINLFSKDDNLKDLMRERMTKFMKKMKHGQYITINEKSINIYQGLKNPENVDANKEKTRKIAANISKQIHLKTTDISSVETLFAKNIFIEAEVKDFEAQSDKLNIDDALKLLAKFFISHPNIEEEGFIQSILTSCATTPTPSSVLVSANANKPEKTLAETTETFKKILTDLKPPQLKV